MADNKKNRPHIPKSVQTHLWLRAGGRCEFRGCNKILYEDQVTQDPINEANIAHIISWKESGPRGDKILSPLLATDITNLMLTCPEHNHLIDSGENIEKLPIGPVKPNPGPILLIHETTLVRVVSKSKLSIDTNSVIVAIIIIYNNM